MNYYLIKFKLKICEVINYSKLIFFLFIFFFYKIIKYKYFLKIIRLISIFKRNSSLKIKKN